MSTHSYEHEGAPALDNFGQLTADWLTAALSHCGVLATGEKVTAVHGEAFAVGVAMLSDLCRVSPKYEPASIAERPGVPSSLVVKFAASSDAKEITISYGGYEQEVRFYREIAPKIDGVRLGPCLYTAMCPPEQRYTLVFDDLATDASLCDTILLVPALLTVKYIVVSQLASCYGLKYDACYVRPTQDSRGPGHWLHCAPGDGRRTLLCTRARRILGVAGPVGPDGCR